MGTDHDSARSIHVMPEAMRRLLDARDREAARRRRAKRLELLAWELAGALCIVATIAQLIHWFW